MLQTSSDVFIFNLGLRFEGLFWERCILKGQITFGGHWRLQSRTLGVIDRNRSVFKVQPVTCCDLLSVFPLLVWGMFYRFPLKRSVIFLNPCISTGCLSKLVSKSHQTFHPVLVMTLLGIMLRNRCWCRHFSHYYNRRCWRMVLEVVCVIGTSTNSFVISSMFLLVHWIRLPPRSFLSTFRTNFGYLLAW